MDVAQALGELEVGIVAEAALEGRDVLALAEAVAAYEEEFGEITAAELAAQARADRRHGIAVRPRKRRNSA